MELFLLNRTRHPRGGNGGYNVRTMAKLSTMLLSAGILLVTAPTDLWAQKEVPQPNFFTQIDPNAPGARFSGPLTISYSRLGNPFHRFPEGDPRIVNPAVDQECLVAEVNMSFLLRLAGGKQLSGFAGLEQSRRTAKLCLLDTRAQDTAIRGFIRDQVVPFLFERGLASSPTSAFAVRAVANVVADNQLAFPGGQPFVIMDVEIAVR